MLCAVLSRSVMSNSLQPYGLNPPGSSFHWGFSRQEYWNALPCLLQGIFPTQGLNPGLLHWREIFLPSEPLGKPQYRYIIYKNLKKYTYSYKKTEWWLLKFKRKWERLDFIFFNSRTLVTLQKIVLYHSNIIHSISS